MDRPRLSRRQSLFLLAFIAILAAIVMSTLVPLSWRPRTGHVHLERMGAFALAAATLGCAFPERWRTCAAVMVALAFGLEALQTLAPTRHGRWPDADEKAVGAALGLLAARAFALVVDRKPVAGSGLKPHLFAPLVPRAPKGGRSSPD